jgi:tetratricopeptide (TPR) repeat protein
MVSEYFGAVRATLADGESRRIFATRLVLVLFHACALTAAAFILVLLVRHGRRWFHDLAETAWRILPGGHADVLLVGAMALAPLLLSFDVLWYGLYLFVLLWGYATWQQKLGSAVALALVIPLFPVLDFIAYDLAVNSSPIVCGAEALAESRYDQRVLDNLEAAKVILPDDPDIRFLLGRLYQALGQNDRAVAEYTTAAQLSQTESRSLINRGNIRFVDGDFGSAQEDYQEALRRDPRNVAARYNLALLYAETFRTVEAAKALNEARALDLARVQAYQDAPTLVKVVSLGYRVEAAKEKAVSLESDPRGRRLLGQYRGFTLLHAWKMPLLLGILLALPAAVLLDRFRLKGRGYASECQKCARTFCRLCKPSGESALLCSQCIHVYLKKDGVAIETKLQKLEDVKRRKGVEEKVAVALNILLPGSSAFLDSRPFIGMSAFFLFAAGVIGLLSRATLGVVPRPIAAPALLSILFWGGLTLAGWILGQTTARRG